jgi:protein tyrosine phosphatase
MKVGKKQKPESLKKDYKMKGKKKKKVKKKNTASIQKVKVDKKDLIEIHERQQRLSRRNSPNIKTRTTVAKHRWKGWRDFEEPSEVITYSIKELHKNKENEKTT